MTEVLLTERQARILGAHSRKVRPEQIAETQDVPLDEVEAVLTAFDVWTDRSAAARLAKGFYANPPAIPADDDDTADGGGEELGEPVPEAVTNPEPRVVVAADRDVATLIAEGRRFEHTATLADEISARIADLEAALAEAEAVDAVLAAFRREVETKAAALAAELELIERYGTQPDLDRWATDKGLSPHKLTTVRLYVGERWGQAA